MQGGAPLERLCHRVPGGRSVRQAPLKVFFKSTGSSPRCTGPAAEPQAAGLGPSALRPLQRRVGTGFCVNRLAVFDAPWGMEPDTARGPAVLALRIGTAGQVTGLSAQVCVCLRHLNGNFPHDRGSENLK